MVKAVPGAVPTYRRATSAARAGFVRVEGTRDAARLKRRLPRLTLVDAAWMREPYERYVSEVSVKSMAASFEMCRFLATVCDLLSPRSILDLGSGISSFIFRHYDTRVVSVDDDPEWLTKTEMFLKSENGRTDGFMHLDDFDWSGQFDLVFHDLGRRPLRDETLPDALRCTRPEGILVLDDVHSWGYRQTVRRVVSAPSFSLRRWTLDEFGRFGMAILP